MSILRRVSSERALKTEILSPIAAMVLLYPDMEMYQAKPAEYSAWDDYGLRAPGRPPLSLRSLRGGQGERPMDCVTRSAIPRHFSLTTR